MEWRDLEAAWNGDISTIRPIGDFVLVRPFPREHGTGSLIINPNVQQTKDGRWRHANRLKGNQLGEVLACGRGDRIIGMICKRCTAGAVRLDSARRLTCKACGGDLVAVGLGNGKAGFVSRAPMHVRPGDIVVYPQVPANEVSINGERLIFLHEEQHVLAVVEGAPDVC